MTLKILIIDDDGFTHRTFANFLKAEGHLIQSALYGEKGLEMALTRSFDIVFVDVSMPDICGIEVVKRIKVAKPDLPVVIMSGFDNLIELSQGCGADYVMGKSFFYESGKLVNFVQDIAAKG